MELNRYKSRIRNFFYAFIQKRQLSFWEKMPRSQMRLYMFLLQNGNNMSKYELAEKLVEIGYSKNRQAANQAIVRGLNNHILIEDGNHLSVTKPVSFVIRFGSIWDSWRILIVVPSILTLISIKFFFTHPMIAMFFGFLTFIMINVLFVVEFFYTVKY